MFACDMFRVLFLLLVSSCSAGVNYIEQTKHEVDNKSATVRQSSKGYKLKYNDIDVDILNSKRGDSCQIYDFNTMMTDDGHEFTPFPVDIMQLLQDADENFEQEVDSARAMTLDNVGAGVKPFDIMALYKILDIRTKQQNFTSINERVSISPRFIIISQAKQKLMMKMTIKF